MGDITELGPVKYPVKFLGELYETDQWSPTLAIADDVFSRQYNIFQFSIRDHRKETYENYWIYWGGWFDNPTYTGIQIFMNLFLTQVFLSSALVLTLDSFWIDLENDIVYMNTTRNPWQYFYAFASLYGDIISTFATAPKNDLNPSDIFYGPVKTRPVMDIPALSNGLNDVISGISVYNSFQIAVSNKDGYYDKFDITKYFNTPLRISKTSENAQAIEDFLQIRYGIVSDIKVDFDRMECQAVDQFFLMNKDYCRKFTLAEYPNLDDGTINDDIPVAWGPVTGIEPIDVNRDTADPPQWIDYIALDPDYITSVEAVYDEDGNELTYSFNATTGIIRVTELDGDGEVIESASMDVTGRTNNLLGEVIIDALGENENIQYIEGVWDTDETDFYLTLCPKIGLYIDGGTTRDIIEAALQNDNAFLIQKNNGLLTLRQWGQKYETWQIPSWLATQQPKKNFADATKYYCSTVRVMYRKDQKSGDFLRAYINDTMENINFERYRKSYLATFETDLVNKNAAADLADKLLERFGEVRETLEISLGVDTFCINPLDTIEFDADINDRRFSDYVSWIVKKCDPGQDTLIIEGMEVYYQFTLDDEPASLDDYLWYVAGIL